MILKHYGLREQPFGVSPNPRFIYQGPGHREALASLIYAIESNAGFAALIGRAGLGKTTLIFHLLDYFRHSARTAVVFNTQCNKDELLRYILAEFGETGLPSDVVLLYEHFRNVLAREASQGRRVIIIIDEAQNLELEALEAVRLLNNFETPECKLLHIILVGQQQLAAKLMHPAMEQLQQRITIICRLTKFEDTESIDRYISHRLRTAGYDKTTPIFTADATAAILHNSDGVPRKINRLCFNALLLGCALDRVEIDASIIEEVSRDLDLGEPAPGESVFASKAELATDAKVSSPVSTLATPFEPPVKEPQMTPPVALVEAPDKEERMAQPVALVEPLVTEPPMAQPVALVEPLVTEQPMAQPVALVEPPEKELVVKPLAFANDAAVVEAGRAARISRPPTPAVAEEALPVKEGHPIPAATKTTPGVDVFRDIRSDAQVPPSAITPAVGVDATSAAAGVKKAQGSSTVRKTVKIRVAPYTLRSLSKIPLIMALSFAILAVGAWFLAPGPMPKEHAQSLQLVAQEAPAQAPEIPQQQSEVPQQTPEAPAAKRTPATVLQRSSTPVHKDDEEVSTTFNIWSNRSQVGNAVSSSDPTPSAQRRTAWKPGTAVQHAMPIYPAEAVARKIQGKVVVRARVGRDGRITSVMALEGPKPLADSAVDAVRRWTYQPFVRDGRAIDSEKKLIFNFKLRAG